MPTITPSVGLLTLSSQNPQTLFRTVIRPSVGAVTLSGVTPSRIVTRLIQPAAAARTLTGSTPAERWTVRPAAALLALAPNTPLAFFRKYTPAAASLSLSGATSSVTSLLQVLWCTWDNNFRNTGAVLSGDNLVVSSSTEIDGTATRSNFGRSTGKWYCELVWTQNSGGHTQFFGILTDNDLPDDAMQFTGVAWRSNGEIFVYSIVVDTISTYGQGDVIGIAINFDTYRIWFRKNGGDWNDNPSADPATGAGGYDWSFATTAQPGESEYFIACRNEPAAASTDITTANFGASTFADPAPSGFSGWTVNVFWDGTAIRTMPGLSGSYEVPVGHRVDVGYATPCLIDISYTSIGVPANSNFFSYDPLFDVADFFGATANQQVDVFPQISLSNDGDVWTDWVRYQAGTYLARLFRARMVLETLVSDVVAFVTEFNFSVYVPTRVDNWGIIGGVRTSLNDLALAASPATTITFLPDTQLTAVGKPFNGGVSNANKPSVVVTELNWQAGDIVVLTSLSLSQVTVQVTNGGVGVARNVNIRPEGY